ncbi:MAG: hypothetical protein K8I00_06790 [Candidatus Omnitrophica bacterium]|nr:hypothetical protein [Candidatus Omnitrophota bacterium]
MRSDHVNLPVLMLTVAVLLWPAEAGAQDFRRLFKHRGIWVENIGVCPTDMTDGIIDIFLNQGKSIRRINVNPDARNVRGDCREQSVFLVYLIADDREYTYPGYQRLIERGGEFQAHSWGDPADLPFILDDPRMRVVEIDRGTMYLTTMHAHGVRYAAGLQLTGLETDRIVRAVHEFYRPGIKRRIKSDFYLQSPKPGLVTVTFTDEQDKERSYTLRKNKREWSVLEGTD